MIVEICQTSMQHIEVMKRRTGFSLLSHATAHAVNFSMSARASCRHIQGHVVVCVCLSLKGVISFRLSLQHV